MIVSEKEAKTKWCPFVRTSYSLEEDGKALAAAINRTPDGGVSCIASECMAWRKSTPISGYCGLAGEPK